MIDPLEVSRLRSLEDYGVLDTLPEEAFDRLTALAADLFDAPIALVSLVDAERQWFKSRRGLEAQSTPRSWAFCAHAIDQAPHTTLVIEDATKDDRFSQNPLVLGEPQIRFYAGAVLTSSDGFNLGALCVIDSRPRPAPTPELLRRLQILAHIVVDELELRRAKRMAEEMQGMLDLAERMSGVGRWRLDLVTGAAFWSDEVYRILGLQRGDIQPDFEAAVAFYHADDQAALRDWVADAVRSGEGYEKELRLNRMDGELRTVAFKAECQRDEHGQVIALYGVFQDITAHKQALRNLERGERRYKQLAENVVDVIVRVRIDGTGIYASPSIEGLLGYSLEELRQARASDIVYGPDNPKVQAVFAEMAAGLSENTTEYRAVHKDGHLVWVEARAQRIQGEVGAPAEIIAVLRNITERKALEARLAEARDTAEEHARRAEQAEHVAGLGHWRYDMRQRELTWSPELRRIYGLDPEGPIDQDQLVAMTHPDDVKATHALLRMALTVGVVDHETITRITRPDGEDRLVAGKWQTERGPDGEIIAAIGTAVDITEQKKAEAELLQARAEAEAATAVKSEFLANMSHELRTPLTSIIGFTRLATERADLTGLTRNYVERVATASRALLSTVNDILDFSKLEAGQVTIQPQPTSVFELGRGTLDLFLPQAGAKDLRLTHDCDDETQALVVVIDPDRVRQILLNLVGNAVKFTEHGQITLKTCYDRASGQLQVEVIDSGAGISDEEQSRLFQRFSQVDGSLTRTHGGTGLGLAICKGLVEAMGGQIGVESQQGHGSRFWFQVPAALAEMGDAAPGAGLGPSSAEGLRILVADDHPANRELARLVLQGLGAEISEAGDGQEAVRRAEAEAFDVILMDLRMPRLDGLEALKRIRSAPGPNSATPILAFTADVGSSVNARLAAQGFDGVVAKPLDLEALIDTIMSAAAGSRAVAG